MSSSLILHANSPKKLLHNNLSENLKKSKIDYEKEISNLNQCFQIPVSQAKHAKNRENLLTGLYNLVSTVEKFPESDKFLSLEFNFDGHYRELVKTENWVS